MFTYRVSSLVCLNDIFQDVCGPGLSGPRVACWCWVPPPDVVWRCDYKVGDGGDSPTHSGPNIQHLNMKVNIVSSDSPCLSPCCVQWASPCLSPCCEPAPVMCLHSRQNIKSRIMTLKRVTCRQWRSSKGWSLPKPYANVSIKPSLNHEWSEKNIMEDIKDKFPSAPGIQDSFIDFNEYITHKIKWSP